MAVATISSGPGILSGSAASPTPPATMEGHGQIPGLEIWSPRLVADPHQIYVSAKLAAAVIETYSPF